MMTKLDVLFIHPNGSEKIYQGLSEEHSAIEPPIWAAMLANHCRIRGHGARILDCEAERLSIGESALAIKDCDPRLACFVVYGQQPSASTQNMHGAIETAKELKKLYPTIKILFVGAHVAALPKETLQEECIDFVCQNEGVYTISNLLSTDLSIEQVRKVKGLGYKDNTVNLSATDGIKFAAGGVPILNEPEAIVAKKDLMRDLPGMAWDLLPDIKKYRTAGWHSWSNDSIKEPFGSIYTSLGCPFRCSFCMINIINRTEQGDNVASADSNIFRWWPPEFIIEQFDQMANLGIKNVKIADELFVLNPNHFEKVCELLVERDYGFNIWAYSRIDTCKPKYLDILKKAGVNFLGLGIENPNQTLRKEIHKDKFREVRITDICKDMQDAGISLGANYIFGLPMDTHESMKETLDFALSLNSEMANFYCAMAYPGSPLYLQAKREGWELPDSYVGYSQHSYETLNLRNNNLTAAEILKFRDDAWMTFHTEEKYLNFLDQKFGPNARKNVEDTTRIKLKRKLLED